MEVKGTEPSEHEIYKATQLAIGTGETVLFAIGSPWFDGEIIEIAADHYERHRACDVFRNATTAFYAARRARFEFGETPTFSELVGCR